MKNAKKGIDCCNWNIAVTQLQNGERFTHSKYEENISKYSRSICIFSKKILPKIYTFLYKSVNSTINSPKLSVDNCINIFFVVCPSLKTQDYFPVIQQRLHAFNMTFRFVRTTAERRAMNRERNELIKLYENNCRK